jgi:hypothetical protein
LSSDRSRSHEKGCSPPEGSPGSLIATQAINGRIKIQRVCGGKMNKALFAVFLIAATAAQTPLPDQTRQLELQKEAMRRAEAQAQAFTILGFPTLNPVRPVPILWPPLKKMDNK